MASRAALTPAFAALADPVRRRILELLTRGTCSAGDIVAVIEREFAITASAVSQHLRVLRDSGLVSVTIDGARRLYSIETAPLQEVDAWMNRFRAYWIPKLEALATEIARGKGKKR